MFDVVVKTVVSQTVIKGFLFFFTNSPTCLFACELESLLCWIFLHDICLKECMLHNNTELNL